MVLAAKIESVPCTEKNPFGCPDLMKTIYTGEIVPEFSTPQILFSDQQSSNQQEDSNLVLGYVAIAISLVTGVAIILGKS